MKTIMILTTLAALAGLAGCSNQDSQHETTTPPAATNQAKSEAPAAPTAVLNSLAQAKDQAVATVEKQLQNLDTTLEQLAAKSSAYVGDAKTEAEAALAALRPKRDLAAAKLRELKDASQETWQNVKASAELAVQELAKACDDLKAKFPG
jgi:chromosome segregation ATPase